MEAKNGSICWVEVATTDPAKARAFYSGLFGWAANEIPMGAEVYYTIFQSGGRDTAGGYKLMQEQLDRGVPPHWILYIRVPSTDDAFAKAIALGAKEIAAPFDVPYVGRMSVIQDPTGAAISTFELGGHRGLQNFGETGAICWADLNTSNPEKAAEFYSNWLGWNYEMGKDGYRHISNGAGKDDMLGGIPSERPLPPGVPPHWIAYFKVADCKASAAKADELGGKLLMPATEMPDVGTIAVVADPQGAVFSLYQEPKRV